MRIAFEKYQSNGNNFIIIDERLNNLQILSRSYLATSLCNSNLSVGADGILFLQESNNADVRMRLFEQDGSESDMSGNGTRCIVRYLASLMRRRTFRIETNSGVVSGRLNGTGIEVNAGNLQDPRNFLSDDCRFEEVNNEILRIEHQGTTFYIVNIGEPHAVIIDDINKDLTAFLEFIRNKRLFPRGINLNVVSRVNSGTIRVRTLERGVWDYTTSCGTGSICSAVVARELLGYNGNKINIINDIGSQQLTFSEDGIHSLATANSVFTGFIEAQ